MKTMYFICFKQTTFFHLISLFVQIKSKNFKLLNKTKTYVMICVGLAISKISLFCQKYPEFSIFSQKNL